MARKPTTRTPISRTTRRVEPTKATGISAGATRRVATSFSFGVQEVEDALVTGEHAGALEDYFGPDQYQELRQLAKEARSRSVRGGTRVLILPGIMGSKLGLDGNEIWLDPWDVIVGNLEKLSLKDGEAGVHALGVFLLAYEKLKLRLWASGYDVDFFPYDWRLDIDTLGRRLADQLAIEAKPVHLVAHSMGGLVARACLAFKPNNIARIVTLGTPNFGSYSPIQAFRGVHSVVSKIATLDLSSSQEDLAEIFKTFPGLSVMMPSPDLTGGTNYFKLGDWPTGGVRPEQAMLTKSLQQQKQLSTDFDIVQIIGCNKETVVAARTIGDEFEYSLSNNGDGTVPLALAMLPGKRTYYIEETHGSLPNNWTVESAVADILATGETNRLLDRPVTSRAARVQTESDRSLGADIDGKRKHPEKSATRRLPSAREARQVLDEFVSPNASAPAVQPVAANQPKLADRKSSASLEQIVVARRGQVRLEVSIAHCSLVDVDASAYVLGLFSEVAPTGAALVIDDLLDGAVMMMQERRMFSPSVGNIFMLPKGRHPVRADVIAFAGLGAFDSFTPQTLETVGENIVRTFIATRVDDFATVPIGGASGGYSVEALQSFLTGLVRGILDADGRQNFRRLIICEIDDQRYIQLKDALYQLGRTQLFERVEVTLQELPAPRQQTVVTRAGAARGSAPDVPPVYLIVRQEGGEGPDESDFALTASLLTAGYKATIVRDRKLVNRGSLDKILKQLAEGSRLPVAQLPALGRSLAELVLPTSILMLLANFQANHLVVVHDVGTSRIPWDTIHIGDKAPALGAGLSHRYESENLAIAKWLQRRQQSPELKVLLVVNPTSDLPGAAEEGKRVKKLLDGMRSTGVMMLEEGAARRSELSRLFSSGEFDVVHYSGHAYFDQAAPERSGILCAGNEVLSGRDLASLGNLPSLVFFNACEAARIRKLGPEPELPKITARVRRSVGFAEAFLQGGVANYVGTYWPVGDTAAVKFAEGFYAALLANKTLGTAVLEARSATLAAGSADWADYILYGDQNFLLKWPHS